MTDGDEISMIVEFEYVEEDTQTAPNKNHFCKEAKLIDQEWKGPLVGWFLFATPSLDVKPWQAPKHSKINQSNQ